MGLKMTLWEARMGHLWESPIWEVKGTKSGHSSRELLENLGTLRHLLQLLHELLPHTP